MAELACDANEQELANVVGKVPSLEAAIDDKERDIRRPY